MRRPPRTASGSTPSSANADRVGLRRLLWGRGISALGDGLWFTIWALYFTRILHLAPALVGVGMAVAGGAGLAASVPLGALADRFSPRVILIALTAVRGAAMAAYLLVHGTWGFLAVTVPFVALSNGGTAVRIGGVGHHPGRSDAAAARRLPGDRDPGLRGDRP
ncbi:hypothetical protein AB0K82_25030, partial [Actinoallomurus sp. NPDC052274]